MLFLFATAAANVHVVHVHQSTGTWIVQANTLQMADDASFTTALETGAIDPRGAIENFSTLTYACMKNWLGAVHWLLAEDRSDPSVDALAWASGLGHVDVVKALLADGRVHPTHNDNVAIRSASHWGRVQVVRVLLADPRADPVGSRSLRYAGYRDHADVARVLLADGRVRRREGVVEVRAWQCTAVGRTYTSFSAWYASAAQL